MIGKVYSIWIIGLPGAGKTTLANELEKKFNQKQIHVKVLDGDVLRAGINNNLGFSEADRYENIRRSAEVSRLFSRSKISTINAFICPTKALRDLARNIVGADHYLEVYLNTPLEVCERRDPKGLYKRARNGEISNFTGIDAAFEVPVSSHLVINTANEKAEATAARVFSFLVNR